MTAVCLPAGTDVADMALFDVDALPRLLPRDEEVFAQLTAQERLVRFPTGSDGGYLLHLFANEAIPADILRYCVADEKLTGNFDTSEGRIAFGGLESVYANFKPNPNIRSDGLIEPGRYAYTAYQTDFPDELVMQAIRVERTTGERWLGRAPSIAMLAHFGSSFAVAMAGQFALAGAIFLGSFLVANRLRRLPGYQSLVDRREQAQMAFPSIVIELRSNPSLKPNLDGVR